MREEGGWGWVGGGRKCSVGGGIRSDHLLPLRSSADVRVRSVRGPQGGLDGRGGEGVGGDWRGVSVDSPSDSVQK